MECEFMQTDMKTIYSLKQWLYSFVEVYFVATMRSSDRNMFLCHFLRQRWASVSFHNDFHFCTRMEFLAAAWQVNSVETRVMRKSLAKAKHFYFKDVSTDRN